MKQSTAFARQIFSFSLLAVIVGGPQVMIGAHNSASVKIFVDVCLSGDRAGVERLLEQHRDSLVNIASQRQVLSRTAQFDNVHYGAIPLMAAAFGGHEVVVKLLLDRGAVVGQSRAHDRVTALHASAQEGHANITRLLLERGAVVDQVQEEGVTPLHLAIQNKHAQVVTVLLQYGASRNRARKDGTTPLIMAAYKGHFAVAQQLLARPRGISTEQVRVMVNYARPDGVTALQLASQEGHVEVVRLLLEQGARANGQDRQAVSSIYAAALYGHELVFDLLISWGADVRRRGPIGNTLLMAAAVSGNVKLVKKLLNNPQIDPAAVNDKGEDALMYAAAQNKIDLLPVLERTGLSVKSTSYNGFNALFFACNSGSARAAEWFIAHGANVNATWNEATPLMMAAEKGHTSMVGLLLARGADKEIRMRRTIEQIASMNDIADHRVQEIAASSHHPEGFSALDIAVLNRHTDVVTLLEQAEAK